MQSRRRSSASGSRRFNVALCTALAGAAVCVSTAASAQNFPFPSTNISNGLTTSVLTTHEIEAQYAFWKATFLQNCGQGDIRVRYPESGDDTRSEGVGYGMVIAAYMGDQTTFNGLWNYYKRSAPGDTGLMHWRRDGCAAGGGGGDTGSASDADIDAAFGLVVAADQWGANAGPAPGYGPESSRLVASIRTRLFQGGCNGVLLAGTQFADCGCINPSYIPPGYYPAFGAADQAPFWNTARTASYTYFNIVNNNTTGLVPAWSSSTGGGLNCNPQVAGGGQPGEFQADAARTPWRVATDYLWTGNTSAATFLQTMANFASNQRIVHIVDRYNLNGTPLNGNAGGNLDATGFRSSFTMGGFATAMTASTQANLDRFTGAWQSMYVPGDNIGPMGPAPRAFNSSLAILYGLLVTGYMWNPGGPAPTVQQKPALNDQPGNLLDNGDFDQGMLGWNFANLDDPLTPGIRAEGFAMHLEGEMQIAVQRAAARPQDPWEVRLSQPVSVQANQAYLISLSARASAARTLKVSIEAGDGQPYALYGALGNRRAVGPVTLSTETQTYDWVFVSAGTNANARFQVDVADSDATLIIDDVVFATSTLPPTITGDLAGLPPPVVNPDGTPGAGGAGGGTPPAGSGGGIGQVIPGTGDTTGSVPGGPVGGVPGSDNGGLPPPSMGRPTGTGVCSMQNDPACGQFQCSVVLKLCYDPNGYVWDSTANMGQGAWTQPPSAHCGPGLVFWPLPNACYDPVSGYIANPNTMGWDYFGDYYTQGQDGAAADSGCAIGGMPANGRSSGWLLAGLIGAAFGLAHRRRR